VSCVGRNGNGDIIFEAAHTSDAPSAQVSYGRRSSASYDRVDRTVQASANVYVDEAYWHSSHAIVVEHFELHGAAAAWVTIRMTLIASGVTDPSARMAWVAGSARVTARDQTATAETTTIYIVPFIEISTYIVEGEPLEVMYETTADGWGYEPALGMSGRLDFIGLPEGAVVMPCVSSPPLPVNATSWGAVKALYR
jgi:hypothetical protein